MSISRYKSANTFKASEGDLTTIIEVVLFWIFLFYALYLYIGYIRIALAKCTPRQERLLWNATIVLNAISLPLFGRLMLSDFTAHWLYVGASSRLSTASSYSTT